MTSALCHQKKVLEHPYGSAAYGEQEFERGDSILGVPSVRSAGNVGQRHKVAFGDRSLLHADCAAPAEDVRQSVEVLGPR